MGAMDNQETARKDRLRLDRQKAKARFEAAAVVSEESVGAAVAVIVDHTLLRAEEDPAAGFPKLSLAKMKGGDWCASLNNWGTRLGLSAFASSAERALVGLAEKLVQGDPWKALPKG